MICKNCSTKMREIAAWTVWCPNCGTLNFRYVHAEDVWEMPRTGQLIAKLVAQLAGDVAKNDKLLDESIIER